MSFAKAFEDFSDDQRRLIMIRLLCALVSMDEADTIDLVDPSDIRPGRRLPLLGLEHRGETKRRATSGHTPWSTTELPYLGARRDHQEQKAS